MRDERSARRRAAILFGLAASYLVFYFVRLPPGSREIYAVWGVFRLVAGGLAFPVAALFLVCRWVTRPRLAGWRIADAMIFTAAVFVQLFLWDEMGYWVQETGVPMPSSVWSAWLDVAGPASRLYWPAVFVCGVLITAVTARDARAAWVHRIRVRG